jgi:hypothetical protein
MYIFDSQSVIFSTYDKRNIQHIRTLGERMMHRVIRKSLHDFRPLRYSSRDSHAEGEHVDRGRGIPSVFSNLQVLDSFFLQCLSWLLLSRVRKFWRDL